MLFVNWCCPLCLLIRQLTLQHHQVLEDLCCTERPWAFLARCSGCLRLTHAHSNIKEKHSQKSQRHPPKSNHYHDWRSFFSSRTATPRRSIPPAPSTSRVGDRDIILFKKQFEKRWKFRAVGAWWDCVGGSSCCCKRLVTVRALA